MLALQGYYDGNMVRTLEKNSCKEKSKIDYNSFGRIYG